MSLSRWFQLAAVSAVLLTLTSGCIPKIYVIDRQTVLEDEAAGEWPQFEHKLAPQTQEKTPTAFEKVRETQRKHRQLRVLNGAVVGYSEVEHK